MQVTVAVRIDTADDQVSTAEGQQVRMQFAHASEVSELAKPGVAIDDYVQQVEFMPLENDDILADPDTLLIVSYPLSGAIDIGSGVRVIYTPNQGFFGNLPLQPTEINLN